MNPTGLKLKVSSLRLNVWRMATRHAKLLLSKTDADLSVLNQLQGLVSFGRRVSRVLFSKHIYRNNFPSPPHPYFPTPPHSLVLSVCLSLPRSCLPASWLARSFCFLMFRGLTGILPSCPSTSFFPSPLPTCGDLCHEK